ncbi:TetR/AcrR family transcriptional regulator [Mycetocola sp. 2940]|uniref:TetR/AcrR family transcriptional regulator n=1 Tax=Mycetocola sp. 2940 TaxID=3156452 RepID=UPI003392FE79
MVGTTRRPTELVDRQQLSLREQSRLDKFDRIREAAECLLRERSFDEVTMKDVALKARVGQATLFRYLSVKDDLLLLVVGHKMDDVVAELERQREFRVMEDSEDGAAHIRRIYSIYERRAKFYESDPENVGNYLRIGLKPGSELGARSTAHGDRIIALVRSILSHGQMNGVLSSRVGADVVAENCNGLYIHEILRGPTRGFTPDTIQARIRRRLEGQLEPLDLSEFGDR